MSLEMVRDAIRINRNIRSMPDIAHAGADRHGKFIVLNYRYVYRPNGSGLAGRLGSRHCLEIIKRGNVTAYPITDHGDYLVHQDRWVIENNISASDPMRIMRGMEDPMFGWTKEWSEAMQSLQGNTLWIEEINEKGIVFCGMGFPFYSLIPVRTP